MKPRLLDLFCGAGGAAVGYHRAGFDVVGVDIKPQKHYPFEFHQADAMTYLLNGFDVIHASPPCQRYSVGTPDRSRHPDLIEALRARLKAKWIIENVRGAPIRADFKICGCMVGLPLIKRVRHFETNVAVFNLTPSCQHNGPVITVTGHGTTTGNRKTWRRNIRFSEMCIAMGIDWMNWDELSQAIPPAYTEFIGKQLMAQM